MKAVSKSVTIRPVYQSLPCNQYRVVKAVNTFAVKVGEFIDEKRANELIAESISVTIVEDR